MQKQNHRNHNGSSSANLASAGHGMQGIDKAPGEETSKDNEQVVQQTQKGKNKVDGDPTQESDQPIENE
ncbi:MAG TPA: hypothetical protein VM368_06775 [Flavisolibacter sp.]|nr:hypothetical protein [Flavisolibacter sp.]